MTPHNSAPSESDSDSDTESDTEGGESPPTGGGAPNGFALDSEEVRRKPADEIVATEIFPEIWQAFAFYGRFLQRPPAAGTLGPIRALLRKGRKPDELVHAVHGYAWKFQRPGKNYDPEKNRTPKTIYAPGNFDEYLEQWNASQLAGRQPPFMPE